MRTNDVGLAAGLVSDATGDFSRPAFAKTSDVFGDWAGRTVTPR